MGRVSFAGGCIGMSVPPRPLIPGNMTVGSTFTFGKYQVESEDPWPIEWEIVHQTDEYQIAQTKQIIDLRAFDAKEANDPDKYMYRKENGNNNWQYSNIKQFLNSDQATWYSAQHQYDAPPNSSNVSNNTPYDSHKGFLYYFSDEEKSLLRDMEFDLQHSLDGSYTWTGQVWLPTLTQMVGWENGHRSEGTQFSKYTDNASRCKTLHENCTKYNPYCLAQNYASGREFWYWMSSEYFDPYGTDVYIVPADGNLEIDATCSSANDGSGGLAPCIRLPLHA